MSRETCPSCRVGRLEYFSQESGTGVFHPDGAEQQEHVEGAQCDTCSAIFADEDFVSPELEQQIDEAYLAHWEKNHV